MLIATGKTNHLKMLYGRVMRHKDFELCAIGASGIYLLARFKMTKEMFDFTNSSHWIDIKLLIDPMSTNFTEAIDNQTYVKAIKKICKKENSSSSQFVQIGRTIV